MGNKRDRDVEPSTDGPPAPLWRRPGTVLIVILLVAAGLRLAALDAAPPGLHQDEASRAWNARCLLQTGKDHQGQPWPIFHARVFGASGNPSYFYAIMPFQAVFGMNVWTTRLPGALAGVLTVLLTYLLASRMFGTGVGLVAAALLAVNPWAVQVDRLAFGVGFVPLFIVATLLLLSESNLLDWKRTGRPVRIGVALAAGAAAGLGAYTYPAYRIFFPPFLLALLIVAWPDWWRHVRTRKGAMAMAVFVVALAATFGPLMWKYATDPNMTIRGNEYQTSSWVWKDGDGAATKAYKALSKYPGHFGPDFLFLRGDHNSRMSPPNSRQLHWLGQGQLHWYVLPLLLAGAGVVLWRARSSVAARVLAVWVLLYPVGDLLVSRTADDLWNMHALRSTPGICALAILAAVGAVTVGAWLLQRRRAVALGAAGVLVLAAVALNIRYYATYFGEYNDRKIIYHQFHADIAEACEWLKPKVDQYDAVFWPVTQTNQPYMITLVKLDWDPARWFREEKEFFEPWFGRDMCARYGKMRFMYREYFPRQLQELQANGRVDRVLFIVRPENVPRSGTVRLLHKIVRPDGETVLMFVEKRM
jgi:4-amino-4-deoxy-L-arabinose transferase-like glycosyltransferase